MKGMAGVEVCAKTPLRHCDSTPPRWAIVAKVTQKTEWRRILDLERWQGFRQNKLTTFATLSNTVSCRFLGREVKNR